MLALVAAGCLGFVPVAEAQYGPQRTLAFSGLGYPYGVAVDAAEDVFAADDGEVLELPAAASTSRTLPFPSLQNPRGGLAVDAAGDVFVANSELGRVLELPAGTSTPETLPFSGLDEPTGMAVDPAGDVFTTDTWVSQVQELPARASDSQTLPFTGLSHPYGIAVDIAGDAFVADTFNNRVVKLPAGSSAPHTLPITGLSVPEGLAVDTAGDVFVADSGNDRVVELPAGSSASETLSFIGLNYPSAVAVDAAGNVFVTDVDNHRVVELPVVPTVSAVSPDRGPRKGGQQITIAGTGFSPGATVEIGQGHGASVGEADATDVTVLSPVQIAAVVPATKAGRHNVFVTSGGQTSPKNAPGDLYRSRSTSHLPRTSAYTSGAYARGTPPVDEPVGAVLRPADLRGRAYRTPRFAP